MAQAPTQSVMPNASTTAIASTKFASARQVILDGIATKLCAFHNVSTAATVQRLPCVHVLKDFREGTAKAVSKTR